MTRDRGGLVAALVASLTVVAGAGCREQPPPAPPGPGDVALELFELADAAEPTPEQLDRRFDPTMDDALRAELYDALAALRAAERPEVSAISELEGLGRTVVDLAASLPGGGQALYSVQLEGSVETGWRVLWFLGPGVEWPPPARIRGEGLTTSPPPSQ